MNFSFAKYSLEIPLVENRANIIVLENPLYYEEFLLDLLEQAKGEEGQIILSEDYLPISVAKNILIISDIFSYDLNNRKFLNALYKKMENYAVDYFEQKEMIHSQLVNILEELTSIIPYSGIEYNLELGWNSIFKLYNVQFENSFLGIQEKLIAFIKIMNPLMGYRVLVLVNIKSFLCEERLMEIYEMAFYNKIHLILLENVERNKLSGEKIYIIDKDQCLIVK